LRADTGTVAVTSSAGIAGEAVQCRSNVAEGQCAVGHGVELVDSEDDRRHPQQFQQQAVAAGLGQQLEAASCQGSLVASTSTTAASALDAAVTMLRVYCSWPGASPMMNLRVSVLK
jgi:hypothetical protein